MYRAYFDNDSGCFSIRLEPTFYETNTEYHDPYEHTLECFFLSKEEAVEYIEQKLEKKIESMKQNMKELKLFKRSKKQTDIRCYE